MADKQYHSEVIDLPSKGKVYPENSPLSSGKIELKYMTAKEEDILTSQNLIKKGVVIDKLLDALILTDGVNTDDLILGDKNAVMIAARVLAYGPEYSSEFTNPETGELVQHTFNLADCPFKEISDDISGNEFETELPTSKLNVKFKLLTGKEEKKIEEEMNSKKKMGSQVSSELTTRLKHSIISVNGEDNTSKISNFVDNMLARDSLFLRNKIADMSPDIEMKQEVDLGGKMVEINIPLTIEFFWPSTIS
ncbi:MAG: hypothetical protein H8D94_01595 [Candidatus Pelagibacter sp.]|nr:hypothetical protein [Candidatus Pelagibacter sp.]